MSFAAHLEELQKRLIFSSIAFGVGTVVAYSCRGLLLSLLERPHRFALGKLGFEPKLYMLRYQEAFLIQLKIALIVGFVLASPYIFYQLWSFLREGLHEGEKHLFWQYFPASLLLFSLGVLFGYFVLVPYGLFFLAQFGVEVGLTPFMHFGDYISFVVMLTIMVGLIFELPLVMVFFVQTHLVCSHTLKKQRRLAILIIFIVAAILTPPDPITQILMAIPLVILYEIGCIASYLVEKKRAMPLETE